MRRAITRLLTAVGLVGDAHFVWTVLGGGTVIGGVTAVVGGVVADLPIGYVIVLAVGAFMLGVGLLARWVTLGEPKPASPPLDIDQLTYTGETIRLLEMAGPNLPIVGKTFVDCQIMGPAVVQPSGCHFTQCEFRGSFKNRLAIVETSQIPDGVIDVANCIFTKCTLHQIGLVGGPGQLAGLANSMGVPLNPPSP